MRKEIKVYLVCLLVFLFSLALGASAAPGPCPNGEQLAFPTAEGFGRCAKGGRGGRVIYVTNLNPSGTGSFRACLEATGPRYCIFRVGGIIDWPNAVPRINPYITIAGQTAPGDGIMIKGLQLYIEKTDNVIVRHLRLRPGEGVPDPIYWSSIEVDAAHDVIVDHCSIGWATDDTIDQYGSYNVTYQWCIVSEGLGLVDSSKVMLFRHGGDASFLHNLVANYFYRVPSIQEGGNFQMVNNVIYNTVLGSQIYPVGGASMSEFVKNYYLKGPHSTGGNTIKALGCGYDEGIVDCAYTDNSKIYLKGNYHNTLRPDDTYPETSLLFQLGNQPIPVVTTPLGFPTITSETSAQQARLDVLAKAGAIVPKRDSIDTRAINDVNQGTGRKINRISEVGGYPFYASGTPYPDADGDGMSDLWETQHSLNPNDTTDGAKISGNGYTNLENFLNELAGDPIPGFDPSKFDFSLSSEGDKSVMQGQSITNKVTATLSSGTSQLVSYSASGLPSGAQASFSPTSCNPTCTTIMTINTVSTTPIGTSTIIVTGTGSGVTKTTSFALTVNTNPTQDTTPPIISSVSSSGASGATKKLILLQQRVLTNPDGSTAINSPSYIKQNAAYIDTLPFNGIAISDNSDSLTLMDGNLHSYSSIMNNFASVKGVTWNRMKYNFGIVNVDKPADFFDDWTNTIESFKNFARAMKDIGVQGILFDNEEYQRNLWHYPADVKYPSKTLQEYYDQTRLRGKQIMEAIKSVYPDVYFMVLISPSHSYSKTPNIVDCWHQSNNLAGAFTIGLMEASPINPIIDGHESAYIYRTTQEFDAGYQFRKYTMGTDSENVPFVSSSLRPNWQDRVSISHGLYNGAISACDGKRSINEGTLRSMLEYAIKKSDEFTWQYWEGGNWYTPGGISQSWFDAVKGAWEATDAGTLTPTGTGSVTKTTSSSLTVSGVDTTPPIRTNPQPTGTLPAGTTSTTISLNTNEAATCKYSTSQGISYNNMPFTFSTTGGTSHSSTIMGLSNGKSYNYYVKCKDANGNTN